MQNNTEKRPSAVLVGVQLPGATEQDLRLSLAELGRRNQVVYFTHHAHLVDLARRTVPEGEWAVRDLVQRPAAG